MARHQQQNRVARTNRGDSMLEQNISIDDSLLPNAAELEKLKDVDPTIIEWILRRTEIEQDARIRFNDNRVRLADFDLHKIHSFNKTALWFGFLSFLAILTLSGFLIYKGLHIEGTIFGGTAIFGCVMFFIKASIASKTKPDNK